MHIWRAAWTGRRLRCASDQQADRAVLPGGFFKLRWHRASTSSLGDCPEMYGAINILIQAHGVPEIRSG